MPVYKIIKQKLYVKFIKKSPTKLNKQRKLKIIILKKKDYQD